MAKKKRTNPRKRVATSKNVEDAKQEATGNGIEAALIVMFSALHDKEGWRRKRMYDCKGCEALNKLWLEEEAKEFDPAKLKAGDRIKMRKIGNSGFFTFEVVFNSFPTLWLRFRYSENGVPQEGDKNFLISYDDLLNENEVREVAGSEER